MTTATYETIETWQGDVDDPATEPWHHDADFFERRWRQGIVLTTAWTLAWAAVWVLLMVKSL